MEPDPLAASRRSSFSISYPSDATFSLRFLSIPNIEQLRALLSRIMNVVRAFFSYSHYPPSTLSHCVADVSLRVGIFSRLAFLSLG